MTSSNKDFYSETISLLTQIIAGNDTTRLQEKIENISTLKISDKMHEKLAKKLKKYTEELSKFSQQKHDNELAKQMNAKKDQLIAETNHILHGHIGTIIKIFLGLVAGALALYLTGPALLTWTIIEKGLTVFAIAISSITIGYGIPEAAYSLGKMSGCFFKADKAVENYATLAKDETMVKICNK